MTIRLSTGLRNKMLGMVSEIHAFKAANTIAFVDSGPDTITDSGNGLVAAGFLPGDKLFVAGTANNNTTVTTPFTIASVAVGTITLDAGDSLTAEGAGTVFALAAARGGSFKDVFKDGVLRIYSGSQPANADTAAAGTLLLEITVSAGAFAHGSYANGLEFGDAALGIIDKSASETWQGLGLAAGTAAWFRLCANPTDAGGASTTLPRIDGTVGTSSTDIVMGSTSIAAGSTYTVDQFQFTLPYQYGS